MPGGLYDAGPVFAADRPEIVHRFQVTNTTDRPVRILGERHSCTCTAPELPRVALRPGESTTLILTVSIPPAYARREVSCTVITDHPSHPEWNYGIRFESFPRARIEPELLHVGRLTPWMESGDGTDRRVVETWLELFAPPGVSFPEPTEPADNGDGLTVRLERPPLLESFVSGVKRARYRISVELDAKRLPPGAFAQDLSIPIPGAPPASATLSGEVVAPLACLPAQVHFGMVSAGDSAVTWRVIVRSVEGRPFRLETPGDEEIGPTVQMKGGANRTSLDVDHFVDLTLAVPSGETRRTLAGTVRIRTDSPSFPEVRIPWSAFIRRSDARTAGAFASPRIPRKETR